MIDWPDAAWWTKTSFVVIAVILSCVVWTLAVGSLPLAVYVLFWIIAWLLIPIVKVEKTE